MGTGAIVVRAIEIASTEMESGACGVAIMSRRTEHDHGARAMTSPTEKWIGRAPARFVSDGGV